MPFKKNDPNINLEGRPKGSKNKATLAREKLIEILMKRMPEVETMNIKDFYRGIAALLPKEHTVDLKTDDEINISIKFIGENKDKDDSKL